MSDANNEIVVGFNEALDPGRVAAINKRLTDGLATAKPGRINVIKSGDHQLKIRIANTSRSAEFTAYRVLEEEGGGIPGARVLLSAEFPVDGSDRIEGKIRSAVNKECASRDEEIGLKVEVGEEKNAKIPVRISFFVERELAAQQREKQSMGGILESLGGEVPGVTR